jgi:hypothetical protein
MHWTCPACQNAIRHSATAGAPRPGVTYRCTVCRLELIVDLERTCMTLAPFPADEDDERPGRRTAGTPSGPAAAADRAHRRSR